MTMPPLSSLCPQESPQRSGLDVRLWAQSSHVRDGAYPALPLVRLNCTCSWVQSPLMPGREVYQPANAA